MKKIIYQILRWTALVEGLSFVLLLAAMPLKYQFGIPEPVWYLGWTHGYLLMGFIGAILIALPILRWSLWRGLLLFFASLLPFGTLILDLWVKKWWQDEQAIESPEGEATTQNA
ncbi:DUF3817 domain-containing protein [Porticoccaceae bacterium LTM1]|nr:DUF3817 domain-containing protein [Porticoccaceae bacterium LTM1]